jgi:peptidyl-prolyl cis-trans isomerase C
MSSLDRDLLPRLGRFIRVGVALPIVASLAIGCATSRESRESASGDPHAECDAAQTRLMAQHTEALERLKTDARAAQDEAALLRRELERVQSEVRSGRERAVAQEAAIEAALASIRAKEEELARLRDGPNAGDSDAVDAASALLLQKQRQIEALQVELARAKNPDAVVDAPAPGEGGVVLANLDLEVPVATVDGEPITRRDFIDFLYRDLATPALLELYVNRHLIIREARRRELTVSDLDCVMWVEEQLLQQIGQAESPAKFEQKIAEQGFDRAAWEARLRYQARPMLLLQRLVELERSTPEGREAFEARLREEYTKTYSERVRAGHIFVPAPRGATEQEVADALELARAASEQVRRGVPFADVARRLSKDPETRHLGGTLGTFDRSRFARSPELNTALFTLEVGRVSAPVRSALGFHVILVEERTPASRPFDDAVRQELTGKLSKEPPASTELEALVARLRARVNVTRTLTFD